MGAALFYVQYVKSGLKIEEAITKTAGAVIGMIPSGLYLVTSVALAVGVIRLAKNNVLVQELYCIEMLARIDVLCLDKTGTRKLSLPWQMLNAQKRILITPVRSVPLRSASWLSSSITSSVFARISSSSGFTYFFMLFIPFFQNRFCPNYSTAGHSKVTASPYTFSPFTSA